MDFKSLNKLPISVKKSLLSCFKGATNKSVNIKPNKEKPIFDEPIKNIDKTTAVISKEKKKVKQIVKLVDKPVIIIEDNKKIIKTTTDVVVVENLAVVNELSPEILQAKEDLINLKKTFSKLLLPVKWSCGITYKDLE